MTSIHLIRHAKAKNRFEWREPDDLRPLTKRGRRETAALAERLQEHTLGRLVSSPYTRCLQTLEPLALDLPIETTDSLAEGADGTHALELLLALGDGDVACCTHGDVLSAVVQTVARAGVPTDGPLHALVASAWVLEIEDEPVVGARFVGRPPH